MVLCVALAEILPGELAKSPRLHRCVVAAFSGLGLMAFILDSGRDGLRWSETFSCPPNSGFVIKVTGGVRRVSSLIRQN